MHQTKSSYSEGMNQPQNNEEAFKELLRLAEEGQTDELEILLEEREKHNLSELQLNKALILAVQKSRLTTTEHLECIEKLIAWGANVDAVDKDSRKSVLTFVCEKGNIQILKSILEHGPTV